MRPLVTMRAALADPDLFGPHMAGDSWLPWRALLIAIMGEGLTPREREAFHKLTGRTLEPGLRCEEFWAIVGRRGGKTRAMAILAAYLAALCDYRGLLAIGERGLVLFLAMNVRQAQIAFGYADGLFHAIPTLAEKVVNRTADTITLDNQIVLEIRPASKGGLRGFTCVGAILDEIAHWMTDVEAANPDVEIVNAVRPTLLTTKGPLLAVSSPHARSGELYENYVKHYGADGDPLIVVAKGTTLDLHPDLDPAWIERQIARDPARGKAEYLAEFRADLERFISREAIEALVERGVCERPHIPGTVYVAFMDQSLGMSDSFALSIWHLDRDGGRPIEDRRMEWRPPFSPAAVCGEAARIIRSYGLSHCIADRVGGAFVVEMMSGYGVSCEQSAEPKSELYLHSLALMNSGLPVLLDVREGSNRAVDQFAGLERRPARQGGRDIVDHGYGKHDDVANALAGGMVTAVSGRWGWNWGAYFESWKGEARVVPASERDANNPRPWRGSEPVKPKSSAEEIKDGVRSIADAYNGAGAFAPRNLAANICATCGGLLGHTRSTDGVDRWHPECGAPRVVA
jgi:hypothetical protein